MLCCAAFTSSINPHLQKFTISKSGIGFCDSAPLFGKLWKTSGSNWMEGGGHLPISRWVLAVRRYWDFSINGESQLWRKGLFLSWGLAALRRVRLEKFSTFSTPWVVYTTNSARVEYWLRKMWRNFSMWLPGTSYNLNGPNRLGSPTSIWMLQNPFFCTQVVPMLKLQMSKIQI